jgi:hypothetical protein
MKTHVIAPSGSIHHESFFPQRDQFNEASADLAPDKNLLLAPHLCPHPIPKDWILYNAEQVGCGVGADPRYIELLRQYEVWDYSKLNIAELKKLGVIAKHCPLGYSPCLERIRPNEVEQDIDVLFYGSINERRKAVLLELHNKCKLQCAFGVHGQPILDLIARSKIIVNIHFYESAIHEITRTSYLMANKKFIVSEIGNDEDLEKPYTGGIAFSKYEDLVDTVMYYLASPIRQDIAEIGYRTFKSRSQREMIEKALAA